jgi:hypothetical protein
VGAISYGPGELGRARQTAQEIVQELTASSDMAAPG